MKVVKQVVKFVQREELLWVPMIVGVAAVIIAAGTFGFLVNMAENFGFNWPTILISVCFIAYVLAIISVERLEEMPSGIPTMLAVMFLPILSYVFCGLGLVGSGLLFGYLFEYSAKETTVLHVAITYLGLYLILGIILTVISKAYGRLEMYFYLRKKSAAC